MTHLAAVDLNLLPLLDALLRERHVTRAAQRVGLSQPAASRGLGRLRELLGDPLLVRSGGRLTLTTRAEELRGPLQTALGAIEGAVSRGARFDPSSAERTVRIVSDDYGALVVLPLLVERLARSAPGIDLRVLPADSSALRRLGRAEVDLYLAPLDLGERPTPGINSEPLAEDHFVCLVPRTHPFARRAPSLAKFAAARHALIAPRGEPGGVVDRALAAKGLSRRIALISPHFLAMPFLLASSDLVLTLAERVARHFTQLLPVARFTPPIALPTITTGFYWHERDAHDPGLTWLRGELCALRKALRR